MGFIGSFTHEGTLQPLKESPVLPGSQSLSDSSDQANSEQNMSTVPGGFCPSADLAQMLDEVERTCRACTWARCSPG